jgi:nucleoside-diphosphate-sugar epimerase
VHAIIRGDVAAVLAAPLDWGRLAGKRVLITGASGLLGAYMTEVLLALPDRPAAVVALSRDGTKARRRFAHHANDLVLRILAGDVSRELDDPEPFDFILHAASQASSKLYATDPVGVLEANTTGLRLLLERARRDGAQGVLFLSSGEVYGQTQAYPIAETDYGYLDPATVRACYGESKRMGETLCVAWAHQHGVPAVIVRPAHIYGPGIDLTDGRALSDFVADILARRDIVIRGDGLATRAYSYIADATEGFFTVLLKGTPGRAYNVGDEAGEIAIRDLAARLVALADQDLEVVTAAREAGDGYMTSPIQRHCPSTQRLRGLGWTPRTPLAEGLARTLAWARDAASPDRHGD